MRSLVIGGSGQIGSWLLHHLADRGHEATGTYASVAFPGLASLNAADPRAVDWVRDQEPEVIFYPAGFTWVDECERDRARSRAANLEEPLRIALANHARFVYFSTDYVFDGLSGPYSETDPPHPLSVYGRAKLDAEAALADALGDRLLTLRTTWVFGPERQGKNFAYQLVRALKAGKELVCPSDQISSPSYGPDVARAAVSLVEQGISGLVHVAGPEVFDRVSFARAIAESFALDPRLIVGRPTASLGQAAARPLAGGLLTPRLDVLLPGAFRSLSASLADFRASLAPDSPWADPVALP